MNCPRRTSRAVLALVFAICFCCRAQAKDEVPYKDHVLGDFAPAGMDEDGNVILAFDTVGQATQLGRFTSSGQLVVDTVSLNFTGSNTLTASNGDQIFLDITSGSLTPISPGHFVIELETSFTGGTGRFDNVTGGFSGIGELTTDENFVGSFEGVGEGTISPPGKNKKK